jgi:signal transduction histidine kinase
MEALRSNEERAMTRQGQGLTTMNTKSADFRPLRSLLGVVSEVNEAVPATLGRPLRQLLKLTLQTVGKQAGTERVAVRLVRNGYLVHFMSMGLPRDYLRAVACTPVGVGCCGVAVAEDRPVVVEDIPCSRVMSAFQCLCEKHGLRSVWCLPLRAHDQTVLGGLAIYHDRTFKPPLRMMREVETYAAMSAAAIDFTLHSTRSQDVRRESRRTALRLLEAQAMERQRIAEELHDDLIQEMTGLQFALESAGEEPDPSARVGTVAAELGRLVARLRGLLFELRPLTLEAEGLATTTSLLLDRLSERTGIATRFTSHLPTRVPCEVEQLAYRLIREALQNVKKHSLATEAAVELTILDGSLEIWITDDGVGFDPELALQMDHYGLASIKRQLESIGGSCAVLSAPGSGTSLHGSVPLAATS